MTILAKPARREKKAPRPLRRSPLARGTARIKRGKRPAKKRRTSLAGLHRKLWDLFARYVKDRDRAETCITCPAMPEGYGCHAGHLVRARKAITRYDPSNVHKQCAHCNKWLDGNGAEYTLRYMDKYGEAKFRALIARSRQTKQWKAWELEELIGALQKSGAEFELLYEQKYGLTA